MKKTSSEFTAEEIAELDAELDALLLMTDDEIDTSDIPESTGGGWIRDTRLFYRPNKLEVQVALDDFVTGWFKENAADEQDFSHYVNDTMLDHIFQRQIRLGREHRARVVAEAKASGKITAEKAAKLEAEMAEDALPPYEPVTDSEIAEVLDWHKAARGLSPTPPHSLQHKQEVRLTLDDSAVDWLRENPEAGQDFSEEVNRTLWKHIRHRPPGGPGDSQWKQARQRRLREREEGKARIMRRIQSGAPGLSANTEQGATT